SDPDKAPALGGRLLVGELGCAACHAIEGIAAPAAKQAPILTTAATRIQPDYLRRFIADPATVKPGTTMPSLLHGMDENERQQKVEALVHYLVSLSGSPQHELPIVGARKRGETLF